MREDPIHSPRQEPWISMACAVYTEQLGVNRHAGGSIGEIHRR